MKRSEAARYARWSAAIALFLATATIGVYLRHDWLAHEQKKGAPPAPPQNVERQSNGLTFSKMEGDRKVFTVEASKSTEFRNQDASLLEEVKITIFGKSGDRHDVIRTHSCRYAKSEGSIDCNGMVEIDLQSAADAELVKRPGTAKPAAHVETHNVTFDQASSTAHTNELVTFRFPAGSGRALGVVYNSQQGTMKLLRDVKMTLVQNGGPKGHDGGNISVVGASLEFDRETRVLRLTGPAHAQNATEQLDAGEITLHLDNDYRAQKVLATAGARDEKPQFTSSAAESSSRLTANVLTAWFDSDGWIKSLSASGNVEGSRKAGGEENELTARELSMDMWPEIDEPKQINLSGNVTIKTSGNKGSNGLVVSRVLETDKARAEFAFDKNRDTSILKRAETLAPATMQWVDAPGDSKVDAHTKLKAEKLILDLNAGAPRQLSAVGNVQAERTLSGGPVQTATAKRGIAQLLASGGWSQIELHDNVKFKDGDRSGQSDNAVAVRASQSMALTGHAIVRDISTETRAASFIFNQASGDLRADGAVRSTAFPGKGAVQFSGAPASITSEKMQANAKTGKAIYTGHTRLWQGDAVLESDSIELLQKNKQLNAVGNVRAVFPQVGRHDAATPSNNGKRASKTLWHVSSQTLTYEDLENRAHLEGNVVAQSESQHMRSGLMDLYFTRSTPPPASEQAANASPGIKQISRAVGAGGVTVEEQTRKATAERAEYTADVGKFVMSGGNPTLFDGAQGTTTGRQLTFFLADDTIIVDSENGSRILTKHRVEK